MKLRDKQKGFFRAVDASSIEAEGSWESRSTGVGVVAATRFDSGSDVTTYTTDWEGTSFPDAGHVSRDTTNVASGTGSMRMDILKTDTTGAGQWRWPFGTTAYDEAPPTMFGPGETFYVQFRQYIPLAYRNMVFAGTQFCTNCSSGTHDGSSNVSVLTDTGASWATNDLIGNRLINQTDGSGGIITANTATTVTATLAGGTDNDWDTGDSYDVAVNAGGWKQSIISNNRQSNQLFEVVLQNTRHRGLVQGYHRDSNGDFLGFDDAIATECSGADFVYQNQIDRGPATPSTCLEERQKRGGLFSYGANTGAPDPETGAFIFYPDEWVTYYFKIAIGTFGAGVGVNDTQIDLYAARDGEDYEHLHSELVNLGAGTGVSGEEYFNALWLLPYNTARIADASREDTYTLYDEVIISANPIAAPVAAQGATTELAQFVANMSSNTWAQFTDMTMPATSLVQPTDDPVMSFANQGHWDPVDKKIIFIGQAHGTNYESRMLEYDAAANSWASVTPPIGDGSGGNPSHGYYQTALDPTTGDAYWCNYNSLSQFRRPQGGSWGSIASAIMTNNQITHGLEFNPHMGAEGALVYCDFWGVSTWDKANAASTNRQDSVTGAGDYHICSMYDEDSQAVYFGGGNNAPTSFRKVDNAGTITTVATLPVSAGSSSAGSDNGQFVAGWAGVKPSLVAASGCYEYDAGANTWSSSLVARGYSLSSANTHFLTAIPEYGCVVAIRLTDSSGNTDCWVWKR